MGGRGLTFCSASVSESISMRISSEFSVSCLTFASTAYLFEDAKIGLFFLVVSGFPFELEEFKIGGQHLVSE